MSRLTRCIDEHITRDEREPCTACGRGVPDHTGVCAECQQREADEAADRDFAEAEAQERARTARPRFGRAQLARLSATVALYPSAGAR